jgi:hypothetical protein
VATVAAGSAKLDVVGINQLIDTLNNDNVSRFIIILRLYFMFLKVIVRFFY